MIELKLDTILFNFRALIDLVKHDSLYKNKNIKNVSAP